MTNQEFALSDKAFREACERAGIPPTRRQASKWRLKDGRAWEHRNGAALDESIDTHIEHSLK
jgi:hypothetical protein